MVKTVSACDLDCDCCCHVYKTTRRSQQRETYDALSASATAGHSSEELEVFRGTGAPSRHTL